MPGSIRDLRLALGLLVAWGTGQVLAEGRTATLLMVNDTYRIGGVDGGQAGGLPRLRTLRVALEREAPDLLVLHAGDFLFSSTLREVLIYSRIVIPAKAGIQENQRSGPRLSPG